jgi:hypothetical protein
MQTIKQTLFTGWNFMRWIRLAFGIFFAVQTFQTHDTLVSFVAAFFLFTALTNTGCCGSGGCTLKNIPDNSTKIEESDLKE